MCCDLEVFAPIARKKRIHKGASEKTYFHKKWRTHSSFLLGKVNLPRDSLIARGFVSINREEGLRERSERWVP